MKLSIIALGLAASALAPVLANPVVPKEVDAMPTSNANSLIVKEDDDKCLPAWGRCKRHEDCCSCYCAYSFIWAWVCGGNAWTSCKDADLAMVTDALEGDALKMPMVTEAPFVGINTSSVPVSSVVGTGLPAPTGV